MIARHGAAAESAGIVRDKDFEFLVALCRDHARAAKANRGSSHHALTRAACTRIAVSARPATIIAATCQSSPTTKSYQNAPNALILFMS
jgi:hypothetical protein